MKVYDLSYLKTLKEYGKTYEFLKDKKIKDIERIYSIWRKENLLLKIECKNTYYVFKSIADEEKEGEMDRVKIMKEEYPNLMSDFYFFEKSAYLMKYIDGDSFFTLDENKRKEKVHQAGKILNKVYAEEKYPFIDISKKIKASFLRYRKKSANFFPREELWLKDLDFEIFKKVSDQPSHNDMNAANLLYEKANEGIKLIDPHEVGYNDIARDVGRYCASCFFNNYDYFGQKKKESLEIAEAFLSAFDEGMLNRAKYYVGESFLSFLNFDTVSVPKSVLKKLSINVLTKNKKLIELLEGGI